MTSDELCASITRTLPPLFQCSQAPKEGVRVRTPLLYPDGGIVDVFVLERGDSYVVTDFGDALGWLRMQSVSVRRSRKQQFLVEDVCQTLGIEMHRGQLVLRAGVDDAPGETVLRLAQAVVRVSDIWFTLRNRVVETTADEVNKWLREKDIAFDRAVKQQGQSRRDWTLDYRISTAQRTSLVFLLSTSSRGYSRRIVEHVVAGCVDLNYLRVSQPKLALVSLFDDTSDVWREEDFGLVERNSEVDLWSRPDEFERILTAE